MIVKKNSSILGCDGEIRQPLDADHHNLCKFTGRDDSNYISVRNALKSLVMSLLTPSKLRGWLLISTTTLTIAIGASAVAPLLDPMEKVSTLLAITEAPDDDFNFYHDRWMPGTCSWILSDSTFIRWMQSPISPQTLWISGSPGSGKSILSSFLISHFRNMGINCNFYFFRFGDRVQRSAGSFLRSLAFQIAQQSPVYKQHLEKLCDTGARLEKNDVKSLWQKLFLSVWDGLEANRPIYIVVDGLDESDSPQTLMALLSSTPPCIPLRLLIVSRSTPALSSCFDKFPESMPVTGMSAESTEKDIPLFVEKELRSMHGSILLRRKVMDEVIQRASGNFLWVQLAVKAVLGCHTLDRIEQVLQKIPTGMWPLYQRMEEAMAESLEASDQSLAKALLAWVSCSQRSLSLDELSQALEPEFPHIIDLSYTIHQVCGNLLVVDRKSRVTLLHQTAREYLTKISTGPFSVALSKAHEELFLRCISCLCDPHLRSQIGQPTAPALLSYAARSWSFHLQPASAGSEHVFAALTTFLQSSSVLTWIQTLATQDQLKILVQSSQALTAFAGKRRTFDASIAPNLRPLQALEAIELWAIDLVKIVGKFGRNLIDTPGSIFKFIPEFCPQESVIHRQFGRKSAFSVRVSGNSNVTWDDSLAKVFVGAESQALNIVCAGRYFAILTTSNLIILWDSATCQEIRRLSHQEHVTALCVSMDRMKIASYGFRTTKVWDVSTGQELYSIPNPSDSRALALAFAKKDTVLLAGSDDRFIRRASFNDGMVGWQSLGPNIIREETALPGTMMNSPCSMAFSPDGSQVAVAFRGAPLSIWGVDEPRLVARCRRAREDQLNTTARPWIPVDKVIWHPRSGEVLGIYQDGTVFKWHPLEDSSQQISATASAIACSPDGDLFATSDANGTVKIWRFYDVALIYQLRCEYPVADLAFSPDNRRLYDLRGSFCNVWEPNVLIRISDLDKPGSEAASDSGSTVLSSTMSEAEADMMDPVTALAAGPGGNLYCSGNAEGVVKLLQSTGENVMELWRSLNFMPIEDIVWGADEKHIAFRDLGGKVVVKELEIVNRPGKGSQWSSRTIFDATVTANDGPIQQILLSSTSDFLLTASPVSAQAWSVKTGLRIASWDSKSPDAVFKWMNHPVYSDQLLATGAESAFACSWQDLIETSNVKFNVPDSHKCTESGGKLDQIRRPSGPRTASNCASVVVENATLTQDGAHVMVETTRFSGYYKSERQLMIFSKAVFDSTSHPVTPKPLPSPLLDKLQLPLGVLPGDKFVFLDNDHWLCSWQLCSSDGVSGIERHFFLPRDWLNAESLGLCLVIDNGVLLIPKNGEVASVKSDLGLRW
jgi:WD40 repeat protein